jgi:outer membrane protein assembly factor BamB
LTHPPRSESWAGTVADPAASSSAAKYRGVFRLPLAEDWSWDLPDTGHWVPSRLELGSATIDGQKVLIGSSRSPGLYVLERSSGRLLRTVDMAGPVQASPLLVDGDWVVADTFGNVQRFDADFVPVWDEAYGAEAAIYRAAIRVGDMLVISTGADTVVGLDFDTGIWKWSFTRDIARGSLELAILGSPSAVLAGEDLVVGFSDGSISGLNPASGVERWREQIGGGKFPDIQAEALVIDDLIVSGAFGGPLVGLDAATRARRWENSEAGATSAMVHAGGFIYTTDLQGRLLCIDAADGREVWKWDYKEAQFGAPVRAGGSILVGDVGGTIHAIDRFDGSAQWTYRPMDGTRLAGVTAALAIEGRQVLFTTAGGTLRSLIAEELWGGGQQEEPAHRPDRSLGW